MATDNESFNKDLYNLLKVRGYDPVPLNSQNERVKASQEADVIEFQFKKDGEDYGKVWITVDDAQNIIIYYDEEQQNSPGSRTPGVDYDDTWTGLLKFLKNWAMTRQMSFQLANKDRLGDDMRQREYYKMKEKLGESWNPMGKTASYNDVVPSVKIIVKHNRSLEEGEARYRNVARIFLENTDGERFLAPTTRPGIAHIYARHLAEGGVPNDERWNHIKSMCEDYNTMSKFVRATRNGQFNESAQQLVLEGTNYYNNLRETLSKMRGHRGYQNYFESWTPTLMEGEGEDLSEMFMSSSMDPRIEAAMPILSRLQKPITEMSEVESLSEWASDIMEAGWFTKNKFTCASAKNKAEDFEASDKEEAQKLAAKKWGIDPKEVTVKEPGKEAPVAKPKEPKPDRDRDSEDPVGRAQKDAAEKFKAGNVGGAVGGVGKILGTALGFNEDEELDELSTKAKWDYTDAGRKSVGKLTDKISKASDSEESDKLWNKALKRANTVRKVEKSLVGEEAIEEGLSDTIKKGVKSFKRGMRGWEKGMHDVDTVKAATKTLSPDSKEAVLKAKVGKGSPAELQQKLIKREKNKGVDENFIGMSPQAVAEQEVEETSKEKAARYADRASGSFQYAAGKRSDDRFYDDEGKDMKDVMGNPKFKKRSPEAMAADDKTIQKRLSGLQKAHKILAKEEQVDEEVKEDLGPEQKKVGQLGPTEKVKNNNIGKLVGASESKEMDPELARIIEMAKFKR